MKRFFQFFCCIYFATIANAQQPDIVRTQGITSDLHRAHIGQLVFTEKEIPIANLSESDFLHAYTLTNKSNLFFHVFLANSVTNYLHQLAPALPKDSLVRMGNYQFNFFVDDSLIHQSNLFPGAPYAAIQDTATVLSKPFINYNQSAWWSQFLWMRFMRNGGDSALTEGKHMLRVDIRTYLKQGETIKTSDIIATGNLPLTVYRKPVINTAGIRLNAVTSYDGLPVSTASFDRDKIKLLKGLVEEGVFKSITSIAVIKNGRLLIEEYFNGADRNTLHDPRSVGKSFASTMTGIAINDRYVKSESQVLKEFYHLQDYTNYSIQKESIAIRDLLTMSSTFDGNDDDDNSPGNEENMYPTDNWVKFALDLPLDTVRYKRDWHYFTAGVVLLGGILDKSVPGGLEKYSATKLFTPLHIKNYEWQYTPQHVVNTAGGIRMRTLDFAKYGQLYKNNGKWQGKQIITADWVRKTFTKHKVLPDRNNEYYGYLFWNKAYRVNNKSYETFYCAGNGGNKIFVFTDLPLVVVITATAYGMPYAHGQVDTIMQEYILPAVINK